MIHPSFVNTAVGLLFTVALAGVSSISAAAPVLYSQGSPSFLNVWSYVGQQLADNFVLASNGTVDTVKWQGGYCCWNSGVTPTHNTGTSESFTVNFFADSGTLPAAAPFYTFTGNAVVSPSPATIPTPLGPEPLYEYGLDIPDLSLLAGTTYWISMYSNGFPESYAWANSSAAGLAGSAAYYSGSWHSTSTSMENHVFYLVGPEPAAMPLPGTLALLGLGFLGLAAFRRLR